MSSCHISVRDLTVIHYRNDKRCRCRDTFGRLVNTYQGASYIGNHAHKIQNASNVVVQMQALTLEIDITESAPGVLALLSSAGFIYS